MTRTPQVRAIIYAGIFGQLSLNQVNELLKAAGCEKQAVPENTYRSILKNEIPAFQRYPELLGKFIFHPKTRGWLKRNGFTTIMLVAAVFHSVAGHCADGITEERAKAYARDKCVFAAARLWPETAVKYGARPGDLFGTGDSPAKIVCIWDATIGAGSISESNGCAIGFLNPANGSYSLFYRQGQVVDRNRTVNKYAGSIVEGRKCSKKTVEQLLFKVEIPPGDKFMAEQNGVSVDGIWNYYTDLTKKHYKLGGETPVLLKVLINKFNVRTGEPSVSGDLAQARPELSFERRINFQGIVSSPDGGFKARVNNEVVGADEYIGDTGVKVVEISISSVTFQDRGKIFIKTMIRD